MPTPVEILNSTCIKVVIESSLGDCPGLESPIRDDADIPLLKSGTAILERLQVVIERLDFPFCSFAHGNITCNL
jgi:hypothetical protein